MNITHSKKSNIIAYSFGITIIVGIMKPFFDVVSSNIGMSFVGVLIGIAFVFSLCFISLFSRNLKIYQSEIYLYLFIAICLFQIFNPYTSINRGISSFVSYFFLPMLVYIISSRVLRKKSDFICASKCFYYFSIVGLLYGIYISLFGTPNILAISMGEHFTSGGTLRIRSITGSEQTFFSIVFFSLIVSFSEYRKYFYILLPLILVQMAFYFPKNPITYIMVALIYSYFFSARYKTIFLVLYLFAVIFTFAYFLKISLIDQNLTSDSLLMQTPFGSETVVERYVKWINNWEQIVRHPYGLGIGSASKLSTAINYDANSDFMLIRDNILIQEPHNEYMQLALEASIVAPILLFAFLNKTFLRLKMFVNYTNLLLIKNLSGLIFAFTFTSFFNSGIFGYEQKYLFWFMVGLVFNKSNILTKA